MSLGKRGMSQREVERPNEKGYLYVKSIRADLRGEVLKCRVDVEEE
jgi:hypothetical protein